MKTFFKIFKKNWQIILIVFFALLLRLFRISSYMTFLGDEGRDALVWLHMINNGKFTLIGPQTSIGNMYLGPLYYYLMLPFYAILGTIGPSVGVALFAGATTFLLWFTGKRWFSQTVGLVAAFLYAVSPVAITLSRSSWNPNVMPFFSLLIIWGAWQFWQKNKFFWLIIIGILTSFAVQSHYLGILLIPIVGLFLIIKMINLVKNKDKNLKYLILYLVFGFFCFMLLTVAPLVWFDLRHNFINYKAFYKFFTERQTTVNLKPYKTIPEIWPLWQMLIARLVTAKNEIAGIWFSALIGVPAIFISVFLLAKKKISENLSFFLLVSWIFMGILGMGLYKQHIYDHYFGFLFPAVFLLTSVIFEKIFKSGKAGKIIFSAILLVLIVLNVFNSPFAVSPNYQLQRTEEICRKIVQLSEGKQFNLGMIAKQNYDAGYRYFLEKSGKKAIEIDAQKYNETVTDQLFVVCEEKECNPIGHPQAEIANFGWAKIDGVWELPWGAKLFKLIHNK